MNRGACLCQFGEVRDRRFIGRDPMLVPDVLVVELNRQRSDLSRVQSHFRCGYLLKDFPLLLLRPVGKPVVAVRGQELDRLPLARITSRCPRSARYELGCHAGADFDGGAGRPDQAQWQ